MIGEPIEWLEWSEIREQGFRNEAEREFLPALFAHVQDRAQLGVTGISSNFGVIRFRK